MSRRAPYHPARTKPEAQPVWPEFYIGQSNIAKSDTRGSDSDSSKGGGMHDLRDEHRRSRFGANAVIKVTLNTFVGDNC